MEVELPMNETRRFTGEGTSQGERAGRRDPFRIPAGGRTTITTVMILVAFIVVPGAFLGFLSMRALEHERAYSLERLRESHRQFAALATRQLDRQLREIEARWTSEIEGVLDESDPHPNTAQLEASAAKDPLIEDYFFLTAPGRVAHPAGSRTAGDAPAWEPEKYAREYEVFNRLVALAEEREYREKDFPAAIAAYRDLLGRLSNPQLLASTESYIGRVQLKQSEWSAALETFRRLLDRYPEVRDRNLMYLRLLAQYQIAVALEGLGRNQDALEALRELSHDVVRRSDVMTATQYSYYASLIPEKASTLLDAPGVRNRPRYERSFQLLSERYKKQINDRYLIEVLDAVLNEAVVQRKGYNTQTHYVTSHVQGELFLLAYRAIPDAQKHHVTGLLAAQIDVKQLQKVLSSSIQSLQIGSGATLAIVGTDADGIAGENPPPSPPFVTQTLAPPFDFWQVGVYPGAGPSAIARLDLRATVWTWLIVLMLMSMLVGAYLFIQRARREAYLSRAQTTFVSNVTHELRTPLSSIKMFAELMEMQLDEPGENFRHKAAQNLGVIRRECDRLSRLIDRVIDFSKAEQQVKRYHFEYRDVGDVVSRVLEAFRPHAATQQFQLGLSVEDSLPRVRIDSDAISQVVLNLLSNALSFSEDIRDIQVRVRSEGPAVAIEVSDHGIGIGPKELPKVFDKFYTSRKRMDSRTQSGLGLGLTLSREIVRAHGGEIRVRSILGSGSTFTVVLPPTATENAAIAEEAAPPAPPDARLEARPQ